MKLLAVIVNYRTPDLTVNALASLASQLPLAGGCRVVVVDNHSGDGSAEHIEAAIRARGWDAWVELVSADRNGGFAAGNNMAIKAALAGADPPACVLLLNPDTVARSGSIATLLGFMDTHPEVGIAGSRLEDPDGSPQISAFRFPSVLSELEGALRTRLSGRLLAPWALALPISEQARQVDWVAGAALIIRREVFERVGLLDEDYFLYFEEVEYCLRARRAGFSCWYVPDSRIVHLVGRSTGVSDPRQSRARRPEYWFQARRRYFVRNLGAWRTGLADVAWTGGHLLSRTWRALAGRPEVDPENFLKDFVQHSVLGTQLLAVGKQAESLKLARQVAEDWRAHGRSFTSPGFQAVAVHRFGNWRMTIKRKALRAPLSLLYRGMYLRVRNRYGIELPYTVKLGRRVIFEHQNGVVIHGHASIDDDCVIRHGVTLGNRRPDRPLDAPILGRRVNVGAGAKILGKVVVGDDVSIGANAVVCRDLPANCHAVGVPARIMASVDSNDSSRNDSSQRRDAQNKGDQRSRAIGIIRAAH